VLLYWPGRPDQHPVGSFLEYMRNAPTGCRSNGCPCELNISSIIGIPIIANFLCGRPVVATEGSRPSKDATGQGRDWRYGSVCVLISPIMGCLDVDSCFVFVGRYGHQHQFSFYVGTSQNRPGVFRKESRAANPRLEDQKKNSPSA